MSTQTDPAVLEKLRKLLNFDGDTGATNAERETALAMAQKIAMKHGVDLSEVEVEEVRPASEPFVTEELGVPVKVQGTQRAKFPTSHKWIVCLLHKYFAVDVITSHKWTTWKRHDGKVREGYVDVMQIHGRRTNVQIAAYVYGFLYQEFQRRWLAELKAKPELRLIDRNGFYGGLYLGLDAKLEKERGVAEKEIQHELKSNQSTALVLLKEDEKREAALKEAHPRLRYVSVDYGQVHNYSAHAEGRKQGAEINIAPAIKGGAKK